MQPTELQDELNKLHELRMAKAITQAEYEKRKKTLLKHAPALVPVVQSNTQQVEYLQLATTRPRRKWFGLILFVGGMSWLFASIITDGGAKTDIAGKLNVSMGAWAVFLFIAGVVYMLPTFVAGLRRHSSYWGIFVVNLFLGSTGIVWIGCLVWALTGSSNATQAVIVRS